MKTHMKMQIITRWRSKAPESGGYNVGFKEFHDNR